MLFESKTNKAIKRKALRIVERISFILENSSLHGLRYLVSDNRLEKLFWTIIIGIYLVGMQRLLVTSIKSYEQMSVSFTMETNYLGWNTSFPAISVCESYNSEKVWDISMKIYGKEKIQKLNEFIGDIAFFYGTCFSCQHSCKNDFKCPENFKEIIKQYRSPCEDLLLKCTWNYQPFDCCKHFLPIETEFGICYSINSLHTGIANGNEPHMKLISNQKTGAGVLQIMAKEDYEAFVHPIEDVPFINSDLDMKTSILLGSNVSLMFSIVEVTNNAEVEAIPYESRNCRLLQEKPENLLAYSVYSYSSCIVQCRIDAQVKMCGCTHHLMPPASNATVCDVTGLACLTDYYGTFAALKAPGFEKIGLECPCIPACNEPEYNLVELYTQDLVNEVNASSAQFYLRSLPTLRYNRQVVRTGLDFVCAIGNAVGLFFGASVLSIVEIFYFIFFRKWQ